MSTEDRSYEEPLRQLEAAVRDSEAWADAAAAGLIRARWESGRFLRTLVVGRQLPRGVRAFLVDDPQSPRFRDHRPDEDGERNTLRKPTLLR